jgi:hypothetical protein
MGSSLPQRGKETIEKLIRNAKTNTLISKLLTTFFISVFGLTVFLPMTSLVFSQQPSSPKDIAIIGSVSAFLAVIIFLIVFMGLQVSTAFVSSRIVDLLGGLPLSNRDVSNIIFLCFVRMFDIPLATGVVVFLAVYFLVGGTLLGSLVSFVAIAISEVFALALTIALSKFFYSKVATAGIRSKWQTLARIAFMAIWILPTFGAYIVINYASNIVQYLTIFIQSFSSILQILALVFPFSFGFLVSYATFLKTPDYTILYLSLSASMGYVLLAVFCFRYITGTIKAIGGTGITAYRSTVKDTLIKPQIPWIGIIRKDLRIASRVPAFASLFLLPAMQTIILAFSFSSFTNINLSVTLGALTGISLITLLLPPTLLSMEGLASSYTRTLPMTKRTLISAKTLLSTVTYMISLVVLFFVALILGRDFSFILAYGAVHCLAICAGIMLELTLLTRKFWKEGFSVGNLYSRFTTYLKILIPGFIVVMAPITTAFISSYFVQSLTLPTFIVSAATEFAVMAVAVALQK